VENSELGTAISGKRGYERLGWSWKRSPVGRDGEFVRQIGVMRNILCVSSASGQPSLVYHKTPAKLLDRPNYNSAHTGMSFVRNILFFAMNSPKTLQTRKILHSAASLDSILRSKEQVSFNPWEVSISFSGTERNAESRNYHSTLEKNVAPSFNLSLALLLPSF